MRPNDLTPLFAPVETLKGIGPRLATHHSVHFYLHLVADMRQAIAEGRFADWRRAFYETYRSGDVDPAP